MEECIIGFAADQNHELETHLNKHSWKGYVLLVIDQRQKAHWQWQNEGGGKWKTAGVVRACETINFRN